MNTKGQTPNNFQNQGQASKLPSQHELAVQTAMELINTQKSLGLSLTIFDRNLNKIEGKFENMAELMRNPEFISRLSQELYVSDNEGSIWFKLKLRKGKFLSASFIMNFKLKWIKVYNKSSSGFDFLVVCYLPGFNVPAATAAIPQSAYTPERILNCFPQLKGQTANEAKDIGKLLLYIVGKKIADPSIGSLEYVGQRQGFSLCLDGKIRFSPPRGLRDELRSYLPAKMLSRQYPGISTWGVTKDWTSTLTPLVAGKKELQLLLLFRLASWHSAFFARKSVYSDNLLIAKPTAEAPVAFLVAMLKNTRYDSLDAPPIGPNVKPLKYELEAVNDGMIVAIDAFAADQLKKCEKGYDLMINDVAGAADKSDSVHHISALISGYLKALKAEQENMIRETNAYKDFLCVNAVGNLITPDCITRHFAKLLDENGLPHIKFHALRHSCISLLANNTAFSMKQIQDYAGHSDFLTTFNVYSHSDESAKKNEMDYITSCFTDLFDSSNEE